MIVQCKSAFVANSSEHEMMLSTLNWVYLSIYSSFEFLCLFYWFQFIFTFTFLVVRCFPCICSKIYAIEGELKKKYQNPRYFYSQHKMRRSTKHACSIRNICANAKCSKYVQIWKCASHKSKQKVSVFIFTRFFHANTSAPFWRTAMNTMLWFMIDFSQNFHDKKWSIHLKMK